jgi:hypothetical protein
MWGLLAVAAKELFQTEALHLVTDTAHREKRVAQVSGVIGVLGSVFKRTKAPPAEAVDPKAALAELLSSVPTKDEMQAGLTVIQLDLERRTRLLMRMLASVLLLQIVVMVVLLVR